MTMTEAEWGALTTLLVLCGMQVLDVAAEYHGRRAEEGEMMDEPVWSRWHAGQSRCPACWGIATEDGGRGHEDDCTLAAAIRAAEGEDSCDE
jgi:hypothetical protein